MKKNIPHIIIASVLWSLPTSLLSQNFCSKWKQLQDTITAQHYIPKQINDTMSKGVFDLFLKELDSKGFHLLEKEKMFFYRTN